MSGGKLLDCMLFTLKKSSAVGDLSGVESFIITDEQLQLNRGCYFPMQAMLPGGFPFSHFNFNKQYYYRHSGDCIRSLVFILRKQ